MDFDIAVIGEASPITKPCALVTLVKGIKRAMSLEISSSAIRSFDKEETHLVA